MKRQAFSPFILFFALMMTLYSCASLSGFQDGRSIGKDNADISISLNATQSPDFDQDAVDDVKPDRTSNTALALRAEVGSFGLISIDLSLWNIQIPVYLSVHPSESFTWFVNPRYIHQFASSEYSLGYVGGNTGIMFGSRHKYGLDIGYYHVSEVGSDNSTGLFHIGIGARFKIGND